MFEMPAPRRSVEDRFRTFSFSFREGFFLFFFELALGEDPGDTELPIGCYEVADGRA